MVGRCTVILGGFGNLFHFGRREPLQQMSVGTDHGSGGNVVQFATFGETDVDAQEE